jgi:arylformamidase
MGFIDISRTYYPGMATWKGDTPTELENVFKLGLGDSVNVSRFVTSTHSGTHIDAPRHYDDQGGGIDQLELAPFWGKAQVVTVEKESGPLYPEDLPNVDLTLARRLLIHTACSQIDTTKFPDKIIYPRPEFAEWLSRSGVVLFGTDAPSVDRIDDSELAGHKALFAKGIAILEGLMLKGVPDGVYQLSALPISIQGADGAPCRAVLKKSN